MSSPKPVRPFLAPRRRAGGLAMVWTTTAAFSTYFCVYGFPKPFTAASFDGSLWGIIGHKDFLVIAQVMGYMASKFIGIKVIAEMPPNRRAGGIIALVSSSLVALLLFPLLPEPINAACLFINGLSLGMTFGLVLGFLEGRRCTEALTAGLCTSFILADGVTKSVGAWLLGLGVTEHWMPAAAGGIFMPPLLLSVAALSRVPPPDAADESARSVRDTLDRRQRRALYGRYAPGLTLIVVMFLVVTVLRSLRADFAPQIWAGLGVDVLPSAYTKSELWVALGVIILNGGAIFVRSNRAAFFLSLFTCLAGFILMGVTLYCLQAKWIDGFAFMVMIGLGLYLPYVAIHTTVFERLLAMTRERGNLGFLLYVADAFGYLGYVAVMIARNFFTPGENILPFFIMACWSAVFVCGASISAAGIYFWSRSRAYGRSPEASVSAVMGHLATEGG
jgi:hypothetical protein